MSYTLQDEEIETIASKLVYEHRLGTDFLRRVIPFEVKTKFTGYTEKWYTVGNVAIPVESKFLGSAYQDVKAKITESTEDVVFISLGFALPWDEVQAALNTPLAEDLKSRTLTAIARQMARKEAYFVFQGSSTPSINGILGNAAATSTYTTTKWGATTGPMLTVLDMLSNSTAGMYNKFAPPFDLFISANAWPYLPKRNTTASVTEWEAVQGVLNPASVGMNMVVESAVTGSSVGNVHILNSGASTGTTINPLPAASSNDAVAVLVKSDPDNFQVIVEHPLTMIIDPDVDLKTMTYNGRVFAAYSFRCWDSSSIVKHMTVDFA